MARGSPQGADARAPGRLGFRVRCGARAAGRGQHRARHRQRRVHRRPHRADPRRWRGTDRRRRALGVGAHLGQRRVGDATRGRDRLDGVFSRRRRGSGRRGRARPFARRSGARTLRVLQRDRPRTANAAGLDSRLSRNTCSTTRSTSARARDSFRSPTRSRCDSRVLVEGMFEISLLDLHSDAGRAFERFARRRARCGRAACAANGRRALDRATASAGRARSRYARRRPAYALVLINLIDNAIKHGRSGGTIAIGADASDPDFACVTIDDDGPGVARTDRERIFAPGRARQNQGRWQRHRLSARAPDARARGRPGRRGRLAARRRALSRLSAPRPAAAGNRAAGSLRRGAASGLTIYLRVAQLPALQLPVSSRRRCKTAT